MRDWSAVEDSVLRRMCREGASARQIAAAINRSRSAVISRASRKGVRLGNATERTRELGLAARRSLQSDTEPKVSDTRGTWTRMVVEPWSERKARRAIERALNDNDLPDTDRWAAAFAFEQPRSLRAALGVLAGRLNDPDMLRHVADRLEQVQGGGS